jgi:ATP-binding cassette subfamily B protein
VVKEQLHHYVVIYIEKSKVEVSQRLRLWIPAKWKPILLKSFRKYGLVFFLLLLKSLGRTMTRFLHNTILAFSATTQNHLGSWRNIIYRFRTGHVHLYSKITDYVLVDGNRKLLNLLSISMIAIVLLQVYWFKKSVL